MGSHLCRLVRSYCLIGTFLSLSVVGAARADATISPSTLLASSVSYDGKHVAVSGIVQAVEMKTSQRGNDYDVFELCDSRCVHVFTWGHPALSNGQRLTVRGVFEVTKHVGAYTFHNEIEADEGIP